MTGVLCVDKTDTSKRVFFPAAGRCYTTNSFYEGGEIGYYWSSSKIGDRSTYSCVYRLSGVFTISQEWYYGFTVRPIYDPKPVSVQSVTADSAPATAKPRKVIKDGRICIGDYNIAGQRIK